MKSILSLVDFELFKRDVQIEFSGKFNKKEKKLIQCLDLKRDETTLPIDTLYKNFEVTTPEEVERSLTRLLSKKLILKSEKASYSAYISIIHSFHIISDKVTLVLSDEVLDSFKAGTNYEKLGINKIITFNEKYSYRLYQYIKRSRTETIEISVPLLRSLLEINDTYKRFYDIEKNLLKPIFKDLEDVGGLSLTYKKIKGGEFKSAKILGILIEKEKIKNGFEIIVDEIMNDIKEEVRNFSEVYSLILKILGEKGEEYIKTKIFYAKKNCHGNFDSYLKELLKSKDQLIKPKYTIKKVFKNLFELHSELLKLMDREKKKISFTSQHLFNSKFLVKVYTLKDGDIISCEDGGVSLKVHYNKNAISVIEFFETPVG